MTVSEIETEFPSEWILVSDPQTDSAQDVQQGRVVAHSKNRDDVYRQAVDLHLKRFAILYTGKQPKNTAIIL